MKKLNYYPLLIIISITAFCCKKMSDSSDPGSLQIIKSQSYANKSDALQAIYTSGDHKSECYYYGSFTSDGQPDSIKQVVIKKSAGDTTVNIFFDNQLRVKSLYLGYAGVKVNSWITFDYSIAGQTLTSIYQLDFSGDSSKLLYQFTVNNTNSSITNQVNYASMDDGLLNICLMINAGSPTVPDKFGSQLIVLQGGLVGCNAIIFTGITAIGCLIGGFPGCVFGGIVADYVVLKPINAHADEITTPPTDAPQSPEDQIQNTQLQKFAIYNTTINNAGQTSYGGVSFTVTTDTWTDVNVGFTVDTTDHSLKAFNVSGFLLCKGQNGNQGTVTLQAQRVNFNHTAFQISGNTVTFTSTADFSASYTGNFSGTLSNGKISGIFTIHGDRAPGEPDGHYDLPITVNLNLLN